MKPYLTILLSLCFFISNSQTNNSTKGRKLKSYTVVSYKYDSGKEISHIKEQKTYDLNGNLVELIKYDKNGKIDKHTESIFDENNNEISKTFYEANGKIKKVNKYVYESNVKKTKLVYDSEGNLKNKEEYNYKYFDNDK